MSRSLCGWLGVTTTDEESVTCRLCQRRLERTRERDAAQVAQFQGNYVDDSAFLAATKDPLPVGPGLTRGERAIWRHVLDGVARIVAGESDRERARLRPATRFLHPAHALAELVQARLDGWPVGSLSDPRRLVRQATWGHQSASGGRPDRAAELAEDLHHVRQAWEAAYDGEWDGVLTEGECREACLRRYVAGEGPRTIAEDLSGRLGYGIKAKLVGRVTRAGYGRIWEYLAERGLIPLGRPTQAGEDPHMVESKGKLTDADLFGWGEIAQYLGVSEDTARRWTRTSGLPVRRFMGRVEAVAAELKKWREEHTSSLTG